MGWAIKVYNAIHKGETKIRIAVFEVPPRFYSAVIIPISRSDEDLISHFQEHKIRHEIGETIESAVGK